jgi:hypothetical protein
MLNNRKNIGITYASKGEDSYIAMIRRVEDRAYAAICWHVTDACYTAPFFCPGFFSLVCRIVLSMGHGIASPDQGTGRPLIFSTGSGGIVLYGICR